MYYYIMYDTPINAHDCRYFGVFVLRELFRSLVGRNLKNDVVVVCESESTSCMAMSCGRKMTGSQSALRVRVRPIL